ncbi:hypothetical protein LSH36_52g08014 [Paralvinella palmiformis]|uniref:10-formyltetrahydrofolate dehydrogenase n=1 Tax=Paralvinella palmiformis TaxID=53620 RepID=A0AAD9K6H7_9ANNE|nr:hypothetical protein LSH36_52g08014 [Paralvinella palmiformis]
MLAAHRFVRRFSTTTVTFNKLKIAIIGQSQFGAEVYKLLRNQNHKVVGVFTVPDIQGRPDPLAQTAGQDGVEVFKLSRWRKKGHTLPEVLEQYQSVGAELNVLPYCTQFIPMEVISHPKHQTICYHPSILPRHRGASAINWTLIQGDKKAGFSIFWADDGLDTGPLILQKTCTVLPDDTVDSIYNRFLYPQGILAMGEAVQLVADGNVPKIKQKKEGATYDPIMKKELAQINWDMTAQEIHNFIRGNDKLPGAWAKINGEQITLFGSHLWTRSVIPRGQDVDVSGMTRRGIVHRDGLCLFGNDGKPLNVGQLQFDSGRMIPASKYGQQEEELQLELSDEEKQIETKLKVIWSGILGCSHIDVDTDFFKMGARSMDVVRLIEEVRSKCGDIQLQSEEVYMATTFDQFVKTVILRGRGIDMKKPFSYNAVIQEVNNMEVRFPNQLFINNEFVDSSDGKTFDTVNPTDETVICQVAKGTKEDVDYAVDAAHVALSEGDWGKMNARDRGYILSKVADLMEQHVEELATIESIDSGAVYTLALKTHVGMSIDTFRYFAGWCDKIQGKTIPINNARPSRNLTYTKREPIGVCGIVTPWNYPLMMLAWKLSSCLAAGNTVVLKPAQVTPLTSLKFAELSVHAGFPDGVINIIPGSGSVVGQAIADHPLVRKVGFTGSTPIGKTIMESAAKSNVKKVSLELGGKSPLIIFSDCDLESAVRYGCSSVFFNKGENCIAAGRLFVEESIHDEFVSCVVDEVKKMKIGDPLDRATDHGPQNHRAHFQGLLDYCNKGVDEGATLVYGGKSVDRSGLFLYPTVFTDVEDDMFVAQEESFGPIMIISKFSDGDVEGVIHRANQTEYGLASGVFTKDISKALYVADKLEAGTVFINTYNKTDVAAPFGGFKQSGFGKDLGEEALNEYLKTKAITIEY